MKVKRNCPEFNWPLDNTSIRNWTKNNCAYNKNLPASSKHHHTYGIYLLERELECNRKSPVTNIAFSLSRNQATHTYIPKPQNYYFLKFHRSVTHTQTHTPNHVIRTPGSTGFGLAISKSNLWSLSF